MNHPPWWAHLWPLIELISLKTILIIFTMSMINMYDLTKFLFNRRFWVLLPLHLLSHHASQRAAHCFDKAKRSIFFSMVMSVFGYIRCRHCWRWSTKPFHLILYRHQLSRTPNTFSGIFNLIQVQVASTLLIQNTDSGHHGFSVFPGFKAFINICESIFKDDLRVLKLSWITGFHEFQFKLTRLGLDCRRKDIAVWP